MSEEVPTTPVVEPSTPATPAPEAAPASAPEQPAQAPATAPAESASYFTKEQLAEMETFYRNNGGFEKVFGATKKAISDPQPVTPPEAPQAQPQPQMTQTPAQPQQAPQTAPQTVREGSLSIEELTVANYFDKLAGEDKYAPIADEIRNGKVLEGLKNFNITPVSDGRINDADVRRYLDLYAATKPAVQSSAAPEMSARVDYYNVPDEKAMTYEQATQIELQNIRLRAAGQPEHPLTTRAKEVVREHFAPKK